MISLFRNFAKSKWAIGLLVLVALALLVTGGSQTDVLGQLTPAKVIKAGDRSVSASEFRQQIEEIRFGQQQQTGRSPTAEELVNDPQFTPAFNQRAQQLAFLAWAERVGIRPGKELVLREIRKIEAFFDPVTRQFDETAYRTKLAEARTTPQLVEQQTRDQYTLVHYGSAMEAGARLPRIYGAVIANQTQQTRDGRWFTVTQAMAGTAPAPTDAQLQALLRSNAAQWRRPEFRRASVILFDNPADAQAPISDAEIQQRFEFRRASLAVPERRSFATLTAPNQETATRIAAALRAGQSIDAVGSANNLQPARYADTPRTAVSDPAVAGAVFGLAPGAVSAPVQARVGFVVAKLDTVTPGRDATLADVRPQIVAELREAAGKAKVFSRVEAYEAARRGGKTVEQAIQEVGARTIPLDPLTAEGRTPNGQQLNVPPQMLTTINSLAQGATSDVSNLGQSDYYAIRMDQIVPAAMPTVEQIRPLLVRDWTARENARLLNARAEALTAQVRRGQDIAAVAQGAGAALTTVAGVGQNQEAVQQYGQAAVVGLFSADRGQPFERPSETGGVVVGHVDRVTAATPALAAPEAIAWRQRMGQSLGQTLLQTAVASAAREVDARFDPAQARRALGLAEAPASTAPAKK